MVQRLDKDTSGLLVFARTRQAGDVLRTQLRAHTVERRYVALAHGIVHARRHESLIVPNRGDGLRGSFGRLRPARGRPPKTARRALTHIGVLETMAAASYVDCRLETGRQNQIRIHLAEAGHPLLGETVYVREFEGTLLPAPRLMLHAASLGFAHPRTGRTVRFERKPPPDFRATLAALRAGLSRSGRHRARPAGPRGAIRREAPEPPCIAPPPGSSPLFPS